MGPHQRPPPPHQQPPRDEEPEDEYEKNAICSEIDNCLIKRHPKDKQAQEETWNALAASIKNVAGNYTYEDFSVTELRVLHDLLK